MATVTHLNSTPSRPAIVETTLIGEAREMGARLLSRRPGQHGIGLIAGPIGRGKTTALDELARYLTAEGTPCIRIDALPGWRGGWSMYHALLEQTEHGRTQGAVHHLQRLYNAQIKGKAVLIDEAHHLLDGRNEDKLKLLRMHADAHNRGSILVLCGEPSLRTAINTSNALGTLQRRIYHDIDVAPLSLDDAREFAGTFAQVQIAEDLLGWMYTEVGGEKGAMMARFESGIETINRAAGECQWTPETVLTLAEWRKRPPLKRRLYLGHVIEKGK